MNTELIEYLGMRVYQKSKTTHSKDERRSKQKLIIDFYQYVKSVKSLGLVYNIQQGGRVMQIESHFNNNTQY